VVPLYLDECLTDKALARQLRAAGHLIYLISELGYLGRDDPFQLESATGLAAVLVTQNQRDFVPLHHQWQAEGLTHSGILLTRWLPIGARVERMERAARLLTPDIASNQLLQLDLFATDQQAQQYIESLSVT
jgi:hypothetical protein